MAWASYIFHLFLGRSFRTHSVASNKNWNVWRRATFRKTARPDCRLCVDRVLVNVPPQILHCRVRCPLEVCIRESPISVASILAFFQILWHICILWICKNLAVEIWDRVWIVCCGIQRKSDMCRSAAELQSLWPKVVVKQVHLQMHDWNSRYLSTFLAAKVLQLICLHPSPNDTDELCLDAAQIPFMTTVLTCPVTRLHNRFKPFRMGSLALRTKFRSQLWGSCQILYSGICSSLGHGRIAGGDA